MKDAAGDFGKGPRRAPDSPFRSGAPSGGWRVGLGADLGSFEMRSRLSSDRRPTSARWLVATMLAARPAVLVRLNVVVALPAVTPTVNEPALPFAVNTPGSAMPLMLADTVVVPVLLEKVPVCPFVPVVAVNTTEG